MNSKNELEQRFQAAKEAYEDSPLWGTFVSETVTVEEALELACTEQQARKARMREISKLRADANGVTVSQDSVDQKMREAGFEASGNGAGLANQIWKVRGENF